MHFLFDNAVAGIILVSVALIIAYSQINQQSAQIQMQRGYAARSQAILVAEVLKEDLANVGSGVPLGAAMIVEHSVEDSLTKTFGFNGKINALKTAPYETVRYSLENPATIAVRRGGSLENVTAHELRRSEDGISSVLARNVTAFQVLPQDHSGNLTSAENASAFLVRFVGAVPDRGNTYLELLRWQSRMRPVNMQR